MSTSSTATPGQLTHDVPLPEWLRCDNISIPMMPAVAHKVIEMASDPELSIHVLASLVAKDPVLAARVLSLANSAYSSPTQPITSLTNAIMRLGTVAVRNVVITVSFTSQLQDPAVYLNRGRPILDHALGTAYTARLVAEQARVNHEEAFLCGLLHDIGKLVILKRAHEHRKHTGTVVEEAGLEHALTTFHPAAGALVLRRWKLPDTLDNPIRFHHDYEAAGPFIRLTATIYLANRLSHRYGFGCEKEEDDLLADPVCELLDVDQEWLEATDARAPGLYDVARQFIA
ncbi:MAG: HDOD domain-containing protein [Vicinamibacterales bacterium]